MPQGSILVYPCTIIIRSRFEYRSVYCFSVLFFVCFFSFVWKIKTKKFFFPFSLHIIAIKTLHSDEITIDKMHSNPSNLKIYITSLKLLSWLLKLIHPIKIYIQFEIIYTNYFFAFSFFSCLLYCRHHCYYSLIIFNYNQSNSHNYT